MDNQIIVFSAVVSAIATIAISISAFMSYRLSNQIKQGEDRFKAELADIYKALVISNLIPEKAVFGSQLYDARFKEFWRRYNGKTEIFNRRKVEEV